MTGVVTGVVTGFPGPDGPPIIIHPAIPTAGRLV